MYQVHSAMLLIIFEFKFYNIFLRLKFSLQIFLHFYNLCAFCHARYAIILNRIICFLFIYCFLSLFNTLLYMLLCNKDYVLKRDSQRYIHKKMTYTYNRRRKILFGKLIFNTKKMFGVAVFDLLTMSCELLSLLFILSITSIFFLSTKTF